MNFSWLIALLFPTLSVAQQIDVGRYSVSSMVIPAPWKIIIFSENTPATQYRLREWDGVPTLDAYARGSMALLARPINVDLHRTPVLCWRWRIDSPLKSADMAEKSGDDYAARVYVAFTLPKEMIGMALRTKLVLARKLFGPHVPDAALNYVWDNLYPIGHEAPNAYTDQTKMIVLETGGHLSGRWVEERRNVLVDARRLFGTDQVKTSVLAVASDTDNTGESAHAGFADLHFVEPMQVCDYSKIAIEDQ